MTGYGSTFLKLLLLVTLVVEPVMLSYAMAGMGHHYDANNSMTAEFSLHFQSSMSYDTSTPNDALHQQRHKVKKAMDDCCSSTACCAAVVSTFVLPDNEFLYESYLPFNMFWKGIVLPSETKPPRSLLS